MWGCHMAHELCGTRLGLAIVNEHFVRCAVGRKGGVISVETTSDVLEELGMSERCEGVSVGEFDEAGSFCCHPAHSLLTQGTGELCREGRSRLDAALLAMLLAADPMINPFPPPPSSSPSPSHSPAPPADATPPPPSVTDIAAHTGSSPPTFSPPSPSHPLSPLSHDLDPDTPAPYDKQAALADLFSTDEDTGELQWMAYRAMLFLRGVRVQLVSREAMDVMYARGGW
ncbi:hypothetical protein IAT38_002020 [Cryptococcus sp. DSM 104549]